MSNPSRWGVRFGDPSFLLAVISTCAYYAVLFLPGMQDSIFYRYTAEHLVEYAIVFMFFWGIIDIAMKVFGFPREMRAVRHEWFEHRKGREPAANAEKLLKSIEAQPQRLLDTRIGARLVSALSYITETGSSEGFSDHLRYLSEKDHDKTYDRYSLVRFVSTVAPILGFLGTVVHFGTALSGLSFEGMNEGLSHVVSEMGTAFNTTTIALGAAMMATMSMFLCERVENGFIGRIDRLVDMELANRFEEEDAKLTPFLAVLKTANDETQTAVAQSLQQQINVLVESLDTLFTRFDQRQKHEEERWQQTLSLYQDQQKQRSNEHEAQLRQTLSLIDNRTDSHMGQIQAALQSATSFSQDISRLAETINDIARGEGRLVELQASLANNLQVLHETNQIDGALHGLTAAIHLLTVRNGAIPMKDAA